jgi:hypothetical protein
VKKIFDRFGVSADFIAKHLEEKKFRAEFNFFHQNERSISNGLILFSQNAWFFLENVLEI